jgi:hypothetical protein
MKATTSSAQGLFELPKNSIRAWTMLAATSKNLITVMWMLWMSNCLSSGAYNNGKATVKRKRRNAYHLKILLLHPQELLLQKQHDLLNVLTRHHAQDN